ncbi:MAG: hypothetical protein M3P98_03870 [bacterium]|nr:hypothetical protein [bacterium]
MNKPTTTPKQQPKSEESDKLKTAKTLAILSFPAILLSPINYVLAIIAIVQANGVSGHDAEKKSVKKIAIASIITAVVLFILFFIAFIAIFIFAAKEVNDLETNLNDGDYSVLDDSPSSNDFVSNLAADQVRENYIAGCAVAPGYQSYCECTADELGSDGITRLEAELARTGELPEEVNNAIQKCLGKIEN